MSKSITRPFKTFQSLLNEINAMKNAKRIIRQLVTVEIHFGLWMFFFSFCFFIRIITFNVFQFKFEKKYHYIHSVFSSFIFCFQAIVALKNHWQHYGEIIHRTISPMWWCDFWYAHPVLKPPHDNMDSPNTGQIVSLIVVHQKIIQEYSVGFIDMKAEN